jgi:hypothetical protein
VLRKKQKRGQQRSLKYKRSLHRRNFKMRKTSNTMLTKPKN